MPPEPGRTSAARRLRDRAQALIPLLALAYPLLIQPLTTFRFDQSPGNDPGLDLLTNAHSGSNTVNQLFWVGLTAATLLVLQDARTRARALTGRPAFLILCLLLLVALASAAWSPVPQLTGKRALLQMLVALVSVGGACLARDRLLVLSGIMWMFAGAVAINLPLSIVMPIGRLGGATGLYGNKNILGLAMALAAIFTLVGAIGDRRSSVRVLMAIFCLGALFTLRRSDSETSLLVLLIAPALALATVQGGRTLNVRLLPMLAGLALWTACGITLYAAAGGDRDAFAVAVFGDATFSGRTQIWRFVSDATVGRELLGMGYASFWSAGEGSYVANLAPGFIAGLNQAHNGYLDVMVEIGALGVVLLIALIVAGFVEVDVGAPDEGRARKTVLLTVMFFAVLHNLLESSWVRGFSIVWVTYLVTLGMALHRGPAELPAPLDDRRHADRQRSRRYVI